jgi:hypothetical protein
MTMMLSSSTGLCDAVFEIGALRDKDRAITPAALNRNEKAVRVQALSPAI